MTVITLIREFENNKTVPFSTHLDVNEEIFSNKMDSTYEVLEKSVLGSRINHTPNPFGNIQPKQDVPF